jgi:hypothetical protein
MTTDVRNGGGILKRKGGTGEEDWLRRRGIVTVIWKSPENFVGDGTLHPVFMPVIDIDSAR